MRLTPAILAVSTLLVAPGIGAEEVQRCRIEGGSVSVNNFPPLQPVAIEKTLSPLEVREVGLSRSFTTTIDLAVGEKRPVGPFPLAGKRRAQVQVTQVSPARLFSAVMTRWYVRFDDADAFFDPCPTGPGPAVCAVGFSGGGVRLRPAPLAKEVERLEDIPLTSVEVSVATIDVIGSEGLLVVENTAFAPRRIKVNFVLDR